MTHIRQLLRSPIGRALVTLLSVTGAVLILLSSTWIALCLYELFTEPQGSIAGQERLATTGSRDSGVEIAGWVESNRAPKGTPVRVWFQVTNLSDNPVERLWLSLHAPGFHPPPFHGATNAAFQIHRYGAPNDVRSSPGELWQLSPHEQLTIWTLLIPSETSADYVVTGAFHWVDPNLAGATRTAVLDLGPIRLRSPHLELTAGLKDFFLALAPLVTTCLVAAFGFIFQHRQQRIVQERQVWASLVPGSHEANHTLYLPVLSAIQAVESRLEGFVPGDARPVDISFRNKAFFFLLLSLRAMREVDKKGGFYLQSRDGEELVAACWDAFAGRVLDKLHPYEDLSLVLDHLKTTETISSFERKRLRLNLRPVNEKAGQLEKQFGCWATTSPDDFAMLFLLRLLLRFEMNRLYWFWYGTEEKFPLAECEALLSSLPAHPAYEKCRHAISAYMDQFLTRKESRNRRKSTRARTRKRSAAVGEERAEG